jgi:hypothetical protein
MVKYGFAKAWHIAEESLKGGYMSGVPGFDGHLENGIGFTGLKPATDKALAV